MDMQLERIMLNLNQCRDNLDKYVFLSALSDRNLTAFYKVSGSEPLMRPSPTLCCFFTIYPGSDRQHRVTGTYRVRRPAFCRSFVPPFFPFGRLRVSPVAAVTLPRLARLASRVTLCFAAPRACATPFISPSYKIPSCVLLRFITFSASLLPSLMVPIQVLQRQRQRPHGGHGVQLAQ